MWRKKGGKRNERAEKGQKSARKVKKGLKERRAICIY
jgi:hypothetical protein